MMEINIQVSSRPSIGFPLGLALLALILLCISGFFSCCYHWNKLRLLLQQSGDEAVIVESEAAHSPPKPIINMKHEQNLGQSFTVLMPGDQVPKFVALPSPCGSTQVENIIIVVQ